MSDKAFWSIVGGILVVELIAFGFLVWPKMSAYSDSAKRLQGRVTKMQALAKTSPEKLATEALLEERQSYSKRLESNVSEVEKIWTDRDERFEAFPRGVGKEIGSWLVYYNDAFTKLTDDYVAHAKIDRDDKDFQLPFKKIINPQDTTQDQKIWRLTETLARAVMAHEGSELLEVTKKGLDRDLDRALPLDHFERIRMVLRARLSPSAIPVLLSKLLGDDAINFSLHTIEVAKLKSMLRWKVVEEVPQGEAEPKEPPVEIYVELDALDWKSEAA